MAPLKDFVTLTLFWLNGARIDILTAPSVGFQDYAEFMNYLFSLWNFDALLILQLLIALVAYMAFRTTRQTGRTV